MFESYPIRASIYKTLLRMGLTNEDWGIAIAISTAIYVVLMVLDVSIPFVPWIPLPILAAIGTLVLLTAGLWHMRNRKPPNWLQHKLKLMAEGDTITGVNNQTFRNR